MVSHGAYLDPFNPYVGFLWLPRDIMAAYFSCYLAGSQDGAIRSLGLFIPLEFTLLDVL